ncbi:MAG: ERCC4 domain-containing protein [Oscillospiraceae bacterium]|nr:ERCC4 domain-containing protein [Oscillospiraceae bacterium]
MRTFTVLIDTREQPTDRAMIRYRQFGCPYRREKLEVGDYSAVVYLPGGKALSLAGHCAVERKLGFSELCACYTQGRGRFTREFERAKKQGVKLYILLENSSWEQAYSGHYRSRMSPQSLTASMLAWLARYDCQLIMCKSETSGKLIHDILYREAREMLERMVDE